MKVNDEFPVVLYTTPEGRVTVKAIVKDETLWMTQAAMCELFDVQKAAISKHLKNIFETGELQEMSVVSKMETTAADGKRYLTIPKIRELERTVTGFFDYIERLVERGRTFTMDSFAKSVNAFLEFNEYQILEGYGKVKRPLADQKAGLEYDQYNRKQVILSDFDREVKRLLDGVRPDEFGKDGK